MKIAVPKEIAPGERRVALTPEAVAKQVKNKLEVLVETGAGEGAFHGPTNLPTTMPVHASQLYARNITELLHEFVTDGALALQFDDEILKSACVTHGGSIVNEAVAAALAAGRAA